MHVVFGMANDGGAYPAYPGGPAGALGQVACGPAGLLDILAVQLGLAGPAAAPVIRTAAWLAKLDDSEGAGAPRFHSRSLRTDPWSTARVTLGWRDELVQAGWTPADGGAGRLADLAAAEAAGARMVRGRADVFRDVASALRDGRRPDVERINLVDGRDLLPPSWRGLVDLLAAAGVRMSNVERPPLAGAGTDLAKVQRFLAGGAPERLDGDGTFTILESGTGLMAAEALSDWIAADPASGAGTAIIVPGGDGTLLDAALERRGLPRLGLSPRAPLRGCMQVLPLAFATTWRPFDPEALLRLLHLPTSPIPRRAARRLAHALSREPGIGGPAWNRAWAAIEADVMEHDSGQGGAGPAMAELRAWTDAARFDRSAGMPTDAAVAMCRRVQAWATKAARAGHDLLLHELAAAAFRASGRGATSTGQVERMVEAACGEGPADPTHVAEAGSLRAVTAPGAVWAGCDNLAWWAFREDGGVRRPPWTEAELATLADAGCRPEPVESVVGREAAHWRRAVLHARSGVLLVRPAVDRGSRKASHPLTHLLSPLLAGESGRSVRVPAEGVLWSARTRLGARSVVRPNSREAGLPVARATWRLPDGLSARVRSREESATSLEDLVACQFRWVLAHLAGLRRSAGFGLPGRERLVGNLAHAVAQAVFAQGGIPDPDTVRTAARAAMDRLLGHIAAPLGLPEASGTLAFARKRIPDALADLAVSLERDRMTVVAMEAEREHRFGDMAVRSRIDMVVCDPRGRQGVVDLKWTSSPGRRRREIAEGRAIQLATYSRLVDPAGGAAAGCYLLKQRSMLAGSGSALAAVPIPTGRGLAETWDALAADGSVLGGFAGDGLGLAFGVPGFEQHRPAGLGFAPDAEACGSCDFATICRARSEG